MNRARLTPAAGVSAASAPAPVPDRASRPVPARLVDEEGRPNLGAFRGVISELNTGELGPPFRRLAGRWFLEKRWNYVTVMAPEVAVGIAILDLQYMASAFCYVHDRVSNRLHEFARLMPFGIGLTYQGTPLEGMARLRLPAVRVEARHDCAAGERRVEVRARTYRGAVDLNLRFADDGVNPVPINSVQGLPPSGLVYSHRSGPLEVTGQVMLDGKLRRLEEGESFGMVHWMWAIHPRDAHWTWAAAGGRAGDGSRVVGFNLIRGSDGLGEPENFLWFDGQPMPVGRVSFAMDLARGDGEWAVRSEDGRVRLTFRPDVVRMGKRDAIWAKAYFRQPIGRFSGTLVDGAGKTVEIRNLAGFAADTTVHW